MEKQQQDDLEIYVRNEYQQWLSLHNKEADELRFPIFRQNFLAQLNHDLKHDDGVSSQQLFHLNQFGDLNEEEYKQEMACLETYDTWRQKYGKDHEDTKYQIFKDNLVQLSTDAADDDDDDDLLEDKLTEYADANHEQFLWLASDNLYIKQRYAKWLRDHGKTIGDFDVWKGNYEAQLEEIQENKYQHCIQSLVFDAFSDLTNQAYQQELQYEKDYQLWCQNFGKKQDSSRFAIFKTNYMTHIPSSVDDQTIALNKFADITVGEFATVVSTESFVQKEFEIWLNHYGKAHGSYDVFKGNYLLQLEALANEHCVKSFIFDEFSDLTQAEYEKELIVQFDYKNWCYNYNKEVNRARYAIFKGHHAIAVAKNVSLSQDADLTAEEYLSVACDDTLINKEFQEWCDHYGKTTGNLETFKANLLLQLDTLKASYSYESFVFDEYSDLNQQEYETEVEVQSMYRSWAQKHTKVTTNKRYNIFKENHARSLSIGMELNEDADLTQEEFANMVSTKIFIENEFKEWLGYYGKSEASFDTFLANYLVQLKDIQELHCFKPFIFDEHADKTEEEREWEPIYAKQYMGWYEMYGKNHDDARYGVFKKNCATKIRSSLTNHTKLELTAYADQTKEEFVATASSYAFIQEQYSSWLQIHEKTSGNFETFTDAFLLNLQNIDHSCAALKLDEGADKIDVQQAVESLCRNEYKLWCSKYGKEQHDDRYAMFKVNFVRQLQNTTGMTVQPDHFADKYTPEGFELEQMYQAEYEKWIEKFGKTKGESDYDVFKSNFLQQLEYNEKMGSRFTLNAFGANTKEQYIQIMSSPEKIREEYTQWTKDYDKPVDESRYVIFKRHFLQQLKLEETFDSDRIFHLNDLVDKDEWEMKSFYEEKYDTWAAKYGKPKSDTSYQTFKTNLICQLRYNQENNKCFSVNEFADLTREEWDALKSQLHAQTSAFGSKKKRKKRRSKKIESSNDTPYFVSNPVLEAESFSFSWGKALKP